MKFIILLGRILFSFLFILSSVGHFTKMLIDYAAMRGVPLASFLVPFSGVLALLGGLSILLGYHARIGAWLIVIFLIPVTFMMHNFWSLQDPQAQSLERILFLKNLALLGSAFMIAYFGSGPLSLTKDSR